jgi:two-component sensor histidine kinase
MTLNRSHTGALTPDQEVSPKLGSRGSGPRAFTMQPKPEFKTATLIPSAQSILDALTVAVALLDRDGTIVAVNQGWRTFARDNGANCPDHFIASNYLEVCDHVPGVDGQSARNAAKGIRAVLAGQMEFCLEYPCHSPGEQRWFQLRVSRLERAGAPYAVVAHHDITQRVLAEQERQALLVKAQATAERQHLLIRELHHRVKNALATVQALVGAIVRSTNSAAEFYDAFSARIAALGRTHSLLTEDYWQTASIHEMLKNELQPYDDGEHRITLTGPPVELSADLAVPTGMAIHELTSNAVRHGALSAPSGGVEAVWDVVRDEAGRRVFSLTWTESGGPPVEPPSHKGLGSTLLERVLTTQCRADVEVTFDPAGLRVRLSAPLVEERLVPHY